MQKQKFNLVLQLLVLIQVTKAAVGDHVAAVRCAESADCLRHVDAEIVDTICDNLRSETDPCENFWDYACGSWTAAPYYDHVDNFGAIDSYYVQQMQRYLTDGAPMAGIETLMRQLRTYYKVCRAIKTYYLPMERYFEELPAMPGVQWPDFRELLRTGRGQMQNFSWLNAIAELRRFGLNGVLLDESVGVAYNDSTKYVVELKMPDETDNFENKHNFLYYFVEFGWIEGVAEPQLRLAEEIYALETQLRELRGKHRQDEQQAAVTLQLLKSNVPNIDWQTYFNTLLGQRASQQLPIEMEDVAYIRELAELLAQTDDTVICFYIIMRLCKYLLEVSPQITDKNCVDHLGVVMPLGMNFVFDRFMYKTRREDERVLQQIFGRLKSQFSKYLRANKLNLSLEQLRYLQQKLDKMQLRLGNLPAQMPVTFYDEYYAAANISENNFFHNHWEMLRYRTQQQHAGLLTASRSVNLDAFYVNDDISQIRNAPYFVHQRNLLVVPMIFLQLPFFHHRLHAVFQYSLVGWIMAHELNHAFETEGILLDGDGNESNIGADIKATAEFVVAIKCLERSPTASLLERMADVNGFQLAYDAFFGGINHTSFGTLLPVAGGFTMRQLYFLNFAQFFCGTLPRPVDHDRDDVRVIEVLANMPEFAEEFRCDRDKYENRLDKCAMWRMVENDPQNESYL